MKLRWILRELKNNLRFSILFILNLTIGLIGFVVLDTFKTSLSSELDNNAKKILSADLSISARRALAPLEIELAHKELGAGYQESKLIEFFSMVNSDRYGSLGIYKTESIFPSALILNVHSCKPVSFWK